MVVVRSDGATELRWTLAGVQSGRDMPEVVATDDGGALLWLYDGLAAPDVPAVLYELRPDGTSDALAVGGYTDAAAMHSSRFVVVFDDDGYAVLRLS
jgi:hypothetical protein